MPEIETINSFEKLLEISEEFDGKFITDQNSETAISDIEISRNKNIIYVIGPEGGLTSEEIDQAKEKGFSEINLGNYRLRTETAALVFGALISTNIN